MKAIIIAAGVGSRMKEVTQNTPKCMVQVGVKSLLQYQVETLRAVGITDISVVRGYLADKVNLPGIRYYLNPQYASNNIMESLFCAEDALDGDILITYSDLWYEAQVLQSLVQSKEDIALAVQTGLETRYAGQTNHPFTSLELVQWNAKKHVTKIGKFAAQDPLWNGEFVGLLTCTAKGSELLKTHYHRAKQLYQGKPFQRAARWEKSYLTDLLQEMADQKVPLYCREIQGEWFEIDTQEDQAQLLAFLTKTGYHK